MKPALPSAPGTAQLYTGHYTGLVEKSRSDANPHWLEFLRTLFSPSGEERGVIGCYLYKNM